MIFLSDSLYKGNNLTMPILLAYSQAENANEHSS